MSHFIIFLIASAGPTINLLNDLDVSISLGLDLLISKYSIALDNCWGVFLL